MAEKLTQEQEVQMLREELAKREVIELIQNQPAFNNHLLQEIMKLKTGINTIMDALEDLIKLNEARKKVEEPEKELEQPAPKYRKV